MYVVAQHTIRDRQKAWDAGQTLFNPPAGITLHYFLPNADASKAVCLWEADSLEAVRDLVDGAIGAYSQNEFFAVDAQQAVGLAGVGAPAAARARA